MATSPDILEPLEEQRIIERELNLQNRLYPRPNQQDPESGHAPTRTKRHRPNQRQRRRARLNYHRVHCTVCNHPDRDAIEEGFLMWRRPGELAHEYQLSHRTAIYRHAHALGLFEQRSRSIRFALEKILEESTLYPPSADSIIRAVRAYSCLDDNGRWHEPPRRVIVTHLTANSETDEGGKLFATPSEQSSD